jgi:hypothetical protein
MKDKKTKGYSKPKRIQKVAHKSYAAGRNSKKSYKGAVIGGIIGAAGGPGGSIVGAAIGHIFD